MRPRGAVTLVLASWSISSKESSSRWTLNKRWVKRLQAIRPSSSYGKNQDTLKELGEQLKSKLTREIPTQIPVKSDDSNRAMAMDKDLWKTSCKRWVSTRRRSISRPNSWRSSWILSWNVEEMRGAGKRNTHRDVPLLEKPVKFCRRRTFGNGQFILLADGTERFVQHDAARRKIREWICSLWHHTWWNKSHTWQPSLCNA